MENETLTQYGFEDDERYQRERLPQWARFRRRRSDDDYREGQVHRHLTDDPEDIKYFPDT